MKVTCFLVFLLFTNFCFSAALVIKDDNKMVINLVSHIYLYGDSDDDLAKKVAAEINDVWNKNKHVVNYLDKDYLLKVKVTSSSVTESQVISLSKLAPLPQNNFIRILDKPNAGVAVSFMLGHTNSGIWLMTQKIGESTTAAHEYGHSLGLDHPEEVHYGGVPRLSITDFYSVDRQYWLDSNAPLKCDTDRSVEGCKLAKLDLRRRELLKSDVADLNLESLKFNALNESSLGKYDYIFIFDSNGLPLN